MAARCCLHTPLVCTCEGDYHSSSSILTSSGRVAASRQPPESPSWAPLSCDHQMPGQLLAPANPRQHSRHFPHSINYQYFISSIPTGALVVRKCIGTLVSCNLVEKMTAGSGLSTPHFSNISLDRSHKALFRIIWSPKPQTSSSTLSYEMQPFR